MATKNVFELRTCSAEIRILRNLDIINEGCTINSDLVGDSDPVIVKTFDTEDAALKALESYESSVDIYNHFGMLYAKVTEYWVEDAVYEIDEDGDEEWIDGGNWYTFSRMPETIMWGGDTYRWNEKLSCWHFIAVEDEEEE